MRFTSTEYIFIEESGNTLDDHKNEYNVATSANLSAHYSLRSNTLINKVTLLLGEEYAPKTGVHHYLVSGLTPLYSEQNREGDEQTFQRCGTVSTPDKAINSFKMTDPWPFKQNPGVESRGRSRRNILP